MPPSGGHMDKPWKLKEKIDELEDENESLRRQVARLEGRDKLIEERIIDIIEELGFVRRRR
jgi:predicted nuclease with TOPRIM domain